MLLDQRFDLDSAYSILLSSAWSMEQKQVLTFWLDRLHRLNVPSMMTLRLLMSNVKRPSVRPEKTPKRQSYAEWRGAISGCVSLSVHYRDWVQVVAASMCIQAIMTSV
jgi:hypothetical protein